MVNNNIGLFFNPEAKELTLVIRGVQSVENPIYKMLEAMVGSALQLDLQSFEEEQADLPTVREDQKVLPATESSPTKEEATSEKESAVITETANMVAEAKEEEPTLNTVEAVPNECATPVEAGTAPVVNAAPIVIAAQTNAAANAVMNPVPTAEVVTSVDQPVFVTEDTVKAWDDNKYHFAWPNHIGAKSVQAIKLWAKAALDGMSFEIGYDTASKTIIVDNELAARALVDKKFIAK